MKIRNHHDDSKSNRKSDKYTRSTKSKASSDIRKLPRDVQNRLQKIAHLRKERNMLLASMAIIFILILSSIVLLFQSCTRQPEPPVDLAEVNREEPDWIRHDYIPEGNPSRPGKKLVEVNNIVVHYVGNPGSTAQENRDYFAKEDSDVSSNFIVGLDGEVIECIPITEVAYASNHRNSDTISIEICHPDTSGKFNDKTYESLIKLLAWLCQDLNLKSGDIIRHYDVTGKECPLYYVKHEDAWKQLKKDVKAEMKREIGSEETTNGAEK